MAFDMERIVPLMGLVFMVDFANLHLVRVQGAATPGGGRLPHQLDHVLRSALDLQLARRGGRCKDVDRHVQGNLICYLVAVPASRAATAAADCEVTRAEVRDADRQLELYPDLRLGVVIDTTRAHFHRSTHLALHQEARVDVECNRLRFTAPTERMTLDVVGLDRQLHLRIGSHRHRL